MKRLYWRPQKCSTWSLVAVAAMAVVGIMAVETFTTSQHAPLLQEKLSAANLAADCFNVIRLERLSQGYALDPGTRCNGKWADWIDQQPGHQH